MAKRKLQKMLRSSLSFLLIASLLVPVSIAKAEDDEIPPFTVETEKVTNTGDSILAELVDVNSSDVEEEKETEDDPDRIVSIIVELEDEPLAVQTLETPQYRTKSNDNKITEELLKTQKKILDEINRLMDSKGKKSLEPDVQFTTLLNGFTLDIPYRMIEEIQDIPGIKSVTLDGTLELTEPLNSEEESIHSTTNIMIDNCNLGYDGSGQVIAVLDTALNVNHQAFTVDPPVETQTLTSEALKTILEERNLHVEEMTGNAMEAYRSGKLPFVFNYADQDADTSTTEVNEVYMIHGSQVSGIACGYAVNEEGLISYQGVAPQAQLVFMQIFPRDKYYTSYSAELQALEDCYLLGVDVINCSFGTTAGASDEADASFDLNEICDLLRASGIQVISGQGNAGAATGWSEDTVVSTSEIDIGTVCWPATNRNVLAVGGLESTYMQLPTLKVDGETWFYQDSGTTVSKLEAISLIESGLEYVMIDNFGKNTRDFEQAKGKIAVVERGEISFSEKAQNAESSGALAMLVYDDSDNEKLINMEINKGISIPCASISREAGEALAAAADQRITEIRGTVLHDEDRKVTSSTSYGCTPNLRLKPEIIAPGTHVYSPYFDGNASYSNMSGTSAASPVMAGTSAVVRQYLSEHGFEDGYGGYDIGQLTEQLLLSTAIPVANESDVSSGCLYSPRVQGSGAIDVANALTTPAYLTVEDDKMSTGGKPILNLDDDPENTGEYTMTFQLVNFSDQKVQYELSETNLRPIVDVETDTMLVYDMSEGDTENIFDGNHVTLNDGKYLVTLPAGETTDITLTVRFSKEQKQYYDTLFKYGFYVEGYILLNPSEETGDIPLSLPYFGFYGDWTAAPAMEDTAWYRPADYDNYNRGVNIIYTSINGKSVPLGTNPLDNTQKISREEDLVVSPNSDGNVDDIEILSMYLFRNASYFEMHLEDQNGQLLFSTRTGSKYLAKAYKLNSWELYESQVSINGCMYGDRGLTRPDGTYKMSYYAVLDYKDADGNNVVQDFEFSHPFVIDTTAPVVEESSLKFVQLSDGNWQFTGNITDENRVLAACVYVTNSDETKQTLMLNKQGVQTPLTSLSFTCDIPTNVPGKTLYLETMDYGMNINTYKIDLPVTWTGTSDDEATQKPMGTDTDLRDQKATSPETGDNSHAEIYIGTAAGCLLVILLILSNKKSKKV